MASTAPSRRGSVAWILATSAFSAARGAWFEGQGDSEYIEALNTAYRTYTADPEFQSVPMLYSGGDDGLHEGPTWGAWWTQNSYGTQMASYPFMPSTVLRMSRQSQAWFFNNMADGWGKASAYAGGTQGWAPDGCMCDNAEPNGCNYKQGDGNVPIHDWTVEETLSALVMQAEMLLVTRNVSEIATFSDRFLRTSNFVESRRDAATSMMLFLTGPSSNLLAPSFGGWPLDNGRHAWSYLTGVSVTYTAALNRMSECEKLLNNSERVALYTARRDLNLRGITELFDPSGSYLVRSLDPNGTKHGVLGQDKHGYWEASPNHDAVAFRVVDDAKAASIFATVAKLGKHLRPNVFMLPNTDAHGLMPGDPNATGYDDMACGTGKTCGGIFNFGTWVNGGVWTTTEGRALMAYFRMNMTEDALASVQQMVSQFATVWRMDNPLVNFGTAVYQPAELINQCVDNYANLAALIRGQFEYLYTAETLTLVPHVSDTLTHLKQNFAIRWGAYGIFIESVGVRSSGVASVTLNGKPFSSFNATAVTLTYGAMPAPSPLSASAVNSSFLSATTRVNLTITFCSQQRGDVDAVFARRRAAASAVRKAAAVALKRMAAKAPPPPPPPPPPGPHGFPQPVLWLKADELKLGAGAAVTTWPDASGHGADATAFSPDPSARWPAPTFVADAFGPGRPGVRFTGSNSTLSGTTSVGAVKTIVTVFRDTGSQGTCCNDVFSVWSGSDDNQLNGIGTKQSGGGATVLEIDWAGSGNTGTTDISNKVVMATVVYDTSEDSMYLGAPLCGESSEGPHGVVGTTFSVASRYHGTDGYARFFKGDVGEIMLFDSALNTTDLKAVAAYLAPKWSLDTTPPAGCCTGQGCVALPNCSTYWAAAVPPADIANVTSFAKALRRSEVLSQTVVSDWAELMLGYADAFSQRCEALHNGTYVWPASRPSAAAVATLAAYTNTWNQLAEGLHKQLAVCANSTDPVGKEIYAAWRNGGGAGKNHR